MINDRLLFDERTPSRRFSGIGFRIRRMWYVILFSIFKIMVKGRFDRLLKLEFVSQDRLNNEISLSKEKLTLLMPSHVLEKVNYAEMSSSRLD